MPPTAHRLLLAVLTLAPTFALAGNVQASNIALPDTAAANKQAVVDIFTSSYSDYKKFAFGHDEVKPLSNSFEDPRNGWGATIIDGMSTMAIMNLTDIFEEAVAFASKVNFDVAPVTPNDISVFESTIRYVGGLISSFELTGGQHPALVDKAKQLTTRMVNIAFSEGNVVPFGHVNFANNTPNVADTNIAEAGTLTLEYHQLSQLTGNDTFRKLAENSVKQIASQPVLPGLAGECISPVTGKSTCDFVTWDGGADSYFEYLIKYARLTNNADPIFVDTWKAAVDQSIKTLLRTSTVGNFSYLGTWDSGTILHTGSHLQCFNGGNWIFGGKLLNNDTIVNIGLALADACWNTYASTATGIGPEQFAFISADGNFTGDGNPTAAELAFFNEHGFYITNPIYFQRPEVLESNFYAWRATGDKKYFDRAVSAVESFKKFLPAGNAGGFAPLNDVTNPGAGLTDDTQSFWFAEVLKYLYLTFDDPQRISLDEFVFNTEAHPFRLPAAQGSF